MDRKGTDPIVAMQKWSLVLLGASAVLGVVTLSMVPHVVQNLTDDGESFYQSRAVVWLFPWQTGRTKIVRLKHVCWTQHVLFIAGIVAYLAWAWRR